jgi:type I restriction enzyme S subunit
MIAGLKPHTEMKDSGVEWLGDVPVHWEIVPAFVAYRPREVRNVGMVEKTVLSLSYGRIVVKPEEKLRGLVPESFETYQIVDPGNIIVRTTDLQNDRNSLRIGHAKNRGIITSAYMCLETTSQVENEFGYQYLNAYDLLKIIYGYGSGLRQNLDFKDIKRMPVLLPPKDEQAAIVRFLDDADRRIRRAIAAKQKLIRLLEEQKQAIIHRAVTLGLDPDVRLKPSGIEWLGDVPEHWKVMRLKEVTTSIEQGWSPQCDAQQAGEHEWGVLKVGCVNRDTFDERQNKKLPAALEPQPALEVRHGDILVSRANTRELLGLAAVALQPRRRLLLCDKLFRFRARTAAVDASFLVYVLRQRTSRAQIESSTNGASDSMQNISQGVIRNLVISVPPREEQLQIVRALRMQTSKMHDAVTRTEREITLLREYRTRLIADVVTGKLDVREAAARLPDAPESGLADDEALDIEGDDAPLDEAITEDEAA